MSGKKTQDDLEREAIEMAKMSIEHAKQLSFECASIHISYLQHLLARATRAHD